MRPGPACLKRGFRVGSMISLVFGSVVLMIGPTAPAAAQEPDGFFDSAMKKLNLKTDAGSVPDFVQKSRPAETDYMAIGVQHPTRAVKLKSPAEVKAMEADLDAARARNERVAGVPHAVDPAKSPAKARKTKLPTQN